MYHSSVPMFGILCNLFFALLCFAEPTVQKNDAYLNPDLAQLTASILHPVHSELHETRIASFVQWLSDVNGKKYIISCASSSMLHASHFPHLRQCFLLLYSTVSFIFSHILHFPFSMHYLIPFPSLFLAETGADIAYYGPLMGYGVVTRDTGLNRGDPIISIPLNAVVCLDSIVAAASPLPTSKKLSAPTSFAEQSAWKFFAQPLSPPEPAVLEAGAAAALPGHDNPVLAFPRVDLAAVAGENYTPPLDDDALAVWLMRERALVALGRSSWAPYIDMLPAHIPAPLSWSPLELRLLAPDTRKHAEGLALLLLERYNRALGSSRLLFSELPTPEPALLQAQCVEAHAGAEEDTSAAAATVGTCRWEQDQLFLWNKFVAKMPPVYKVSSLNTVEGIVTLFTSILEQDRLQLANLLWLARQEGISLRAYALRSIIAHLPALLAPEKSASQSKSDSGTASSAFDSLPTEVSIPQHSLDTRYQLSNGAVWTVTSPLPKDMATADLDAAFAAAEWTMSSGVPIPEAEALQAFFLTVFGKRISRTQVKHTSPVPLDSFGSGLASLPSFVWGVAMMDSRALTINGRKYMVPFADFLNFSPNLQVSPQQLGQSYTQFHKVLLPPTHAPSHHRGHFLVLTERDTLPYAQVYEDYGSTDIDLYLQHHAMVPVHWFWARTTSVHATAESQWIKELAPLLTANATPTTVATTLTSSFVESLTSTLPLRSLVRDACFTIPEGALPPLARAVDTPATKSRKEAIAEALQLNRGSVSLYSCIRPPTLPQTPAKDSAKPIRRLPNVIRALHWWLALSEMGPSELARCDPLAKPMRPPTTAAEQREFNARKAEELLRCFGDEGVVDLTAPEAAEGNSLTTPMDRARRMEALLHRMLFEQNYAAQYAVDVLALLRASKYPEQSKSILQSAYSHPSSTFHGNFSSSTLSSMDASALYLSLSFRASQTYLMLQTYHALRGNGDYQGGFHAWEALTPSPETAPLAVVSNASSTTHAGTNSSSRSPNVLPLPIPFPSEPGDRLVPVGKTQMPLRDAIAYTSDEDMAIVERACEMFNAWVASHKPKEYDIRAAAVGGGMRLGVVVTHPLKKEDVYLALPTSIIMDTESAEECPILKPVLDDLHVRFPGGDDFHELLFHLLVEVLLKEPSEERSKYSPYLRLLPSVDGVLFPLFFTPEELSYLEGSSVLYSALRYRVETAGKYASIQRHVWDHYPDVFRPDLFTKEAYFWATAILDSRAIWWNGKRHLVPLLDLINCSPGPDPSRVHATRLDSTGAYAMTQADRDYAVGDQLWEHYGQPNWIYFSYHGFSLPPGIALLPSEPINPNPHDCVRIDLPPPGRLRDLLVYRMNPPPDSRNLSPEKIRELSAKYNSAAKEGDPIVDRVASNPDESLYTLAQKTLTSAWSRKGKDTNAKDGASAEAVQEFLESRLQLGPTSDITEIAEAIATTVYDYNLLAGAMQACARPSLPSETSEHKDTLEALRYLEYAYNVDTLGAKLLLTGAARFRLQEYPTSIGEDIHVLLRDAAAQVVLGISSEQSASVFVEALLLGVYGSRYGWTPASSVSALKSDVDVPVADLFSNSNTVNTADIDALRSYLRVDLQHVQANSVAADTYRTAWESLAKESMIPRRDRYSPFSAVPRSTPASDRLDTLYAPATFRGFQRTLVRFATGEVGFHAAKAALLPPRQRAAIVFRLSEKVLLAAWAQWAPGSEGPITESQLFHSSAKAATQQENRVDIEESSPLVGAQEPVTHSFSWHEGMCIDRQSNKQGTGSPRQVPCAKLLKTYSSTIRSALLGSDEKNGFPVKEEL